MSKRAIPVLFVLMCIILGLLIVEYAMFKQQAVRMAELKEDYRNHLSAVKRVLSEYYSIKERLEELEIASDEKKNDVKMMSSLFPEGARIYSSDELENTEFVVVNRELAYLKESTIEYLESTNLDALLGTLNVNGWKEYTDELFEYQHAQTIKNVQKAAPKKSSSARKDISPEYKKIKSDLALVWPVERSRFWISSHFGPRKKPDGSAGFHYGIDMAAMRGTPVHAAASGVVVQAEYVGGYGNMIIIEHNRKYRTRYAHLDTILVKVGQKVSQNQCVGKVGDTGFIRKKGRDGSHLHFEVLAFGKQMNPLYLL